MDLTKLMNKNSQQVKPEPEQPEFSKEEYAAMKKAEREQLWERIDTLTADVLKDAESLHGFLDFAAQCSPERIENLLLFHADAPEATWMKTFDEWKEAERGVRSGAVGYTALIGQDYTREDGTVASGYYVGKKFDVSQTRGRQPDKAPVYAADELVTAFFENSPVRIIVSEELPDGVQAQYVAKNRAIFVPFPVSWTVKMKKKQKETQDILSYHSQAAGCSDKARAKASGGRQPIEECGRTGL